MNTILLIPTGEGVGLTSACLMFMHWTKGINGVSKTISQIADNG